MLAGLHVCSVDVSKDGPDGDDSVFTVTVEIPSDQTIHLYEADRFHISWVRPNIERVCVLAYPREGVERISAGEARIGPANSPPTKWHYDLYGPAPRRCSPRSVSGRACKSLTGNGRTRLTVAGFVPPEFIPLDIRARRPNHPRS